MEPIDITMTIADKWKQDADMYDGRNNQKRITVTIPIGGFVVCADDGLISLHDAVRGNAEAYAKSDKFGVRGFINGSPDSVAPNLNESWMASFETKEPTDIMSVTRSMCK